MARKKISTTIYITPEQNEQLKLLNSKTRVPVAEYIRQGIDLVLVRETSWANIRDRVAVGHFDVAHMLALKDALAVEKDSEVKESLTECVDELK